MRAETIILGGGIAGLSLARALARSSDRDEGSGVILLEAEPTFGVHSSGLNAAILRTAIDAPATRALALMTADELRNPPDDLGGVSFVDERGLILLEGSTEAPAPRWLARATSCFAPTRYVSKKDRTRLENSRVAITNGSSFCGTSSRASAWPGKISST